MLCAARLIQSVYLPRRRTWRMLCTVNRPSPVIHGPNAAGQVPRCPRARRERARTYAQLEPPFRERSWCQKSSHTCCAPRVDPIVRRTPRATLLLWVAKPRAEMGWPQGIEPPAHTRAAPHLHGRCGCAPPCERAGAVRCNGGSRGRGGGGSYGPRPGPPPLVNVAAAARLVGSAFRQGLGGFLARCHHGVLPHRLCSCRTRGRRRRRRVER